MAPKNSVEIQKNLRDYRRSSRIAKKFRSKDDTNPTQTIYIDLDNSDGEGENKTEKEADDNFATPTLNNDDDDFATPPPLRQEVVVMPKRVKSTARKKPRKNDKKSIMLLKRIRSRAPPVNFYQVMNSLNEEQEDAVKEMGFECFLKFKISEIPTKLGYWIVKHFDSKECRINSKNRSLKITKKSIKDTLGIPDGHIKMDYLRATKTGNSVVKEWKAQFVGIQKLYIKELVDTMMEQKDAGRLFKLNFLVLFASVMCKCIKCGTVNIKFLYFIENVEDIKDMDWCGYLLDCLRETRKNWKNESHFNGPVIFLLIHYANYVSDALKEKNNAIKSIQHWDSKKLNMLEMKEIENGEFGSSLPKNEKSKSVKRKKQHTGDEGECSKIPKKTRTEKVVAEEGKKDDETNDAPKWPKDSRNRNLDENVNSNRELLVTADQDEQDEVKKNTSESFETYLLKDDETTNSLKGSKDLTNWNVDEDATTEIMNSEPFVPADPDEENQVNKNTDETTNALNVSKDSKNQNVDEDMTNENVNFAFESFVTDDPAQDNQRKNVNDEQNEPIIGIREKEKSGASLSQTRASTRSLPFSPNIFVGLNTPNDFFRLGKNLSEESNTKDKQPERLEELENEISLKLHRIEWLKEEVEDLIEKGDVKFRNPKILRMLRLRKEKIFNEMSQTRSENPVETNVFGEKECDHDKFNTHEGHETHPKTGDDAKMQSKKDVNTCEDSDSQFSYSFEVLEALDKWNKQLENSQNSDFSSKEAPFGIFNSVPTFNTHELDGDKMDILSETVNVFCNSDHVKALEKLENQLLEHEQIGQQLEKEFVNDSLSGKVEGRVHNDIVVVDAQRMDDVVGTPKTNIRKDQEKKVELHMEQPSLDIVDIVMVDAQRKDNIRKEQETVVEQHLEQPENNNVKDLSTLAAPVQNPTLEPVERKTKGKIRALHNASKLNLEIQKSVKRQAETSHDAIGGEHAEKKPKRNLKLPATSKSLYVIREVLLTKPTTNEMLISEYAISGLHDTNDIIFEHNGLTAQRRVFECLHPKLMILPETIDLWSHIMNAEETKKSPNGLARLFCHTSMMTEEMLSQSIDDGILFEKFKEKMDNVIRCSEYANLENVDLVFFPIIQDVRFYLICYNLCTQEYHILDNKEYEEEETEVDLNKRYDGLPKLLNELLCVYLSLACHPCSGKMNNKEPKTVRLRWRTKENGIDCGIFTMRHMEMYQGELIKDFDPALRKENRLQKNQLEVLRKKYVAKMLLWNLNEKRSLVLKQAAEYNKLTPKEKKNVKKDADERIMQRL